jgi:hypothetical protein
MQLTVSACLPAHRHLTPSPGRSTSEICTSFPQETHINFALYGVDSASLGRLFLFSTGPTTTSYTFISGAFALVFVPVLAFLRQSAAHFFSTRRTASMSDTRLHGNPPFSAPSRDPETQSRVACHH